MKRNPQEMIKLMKDNGIRLYPNLSNEERSKVLFIPNEPEISAKKSTK